jgi:hypothetical protein
MMEASSFSSEPLATGVDVLHRSKDDPTHFAMVMNTFDVPLGASLLASPGTKTHTHTKLKIHNTQKLN